MRPVILLTACIALAPAAVAQDTPEALRYATTQGGTVALPLGARSFADRVVRFEEGDPPSKRASARDPRVALGPPDDGEEDGAFLTLGCRGSIVVEFTDNALVDVPGPDLHVFEIGPNVEPTRVAISRDGRSWREAGSVSGGTASLDIAAASQQGARYRFVRLTDAQCQGRGGRWPGADIDAVAAIGGVAVTGPATATPGGAEPPSSETYRGSQGGTVDVPSGALSFADGVAGFREGEPPSRRAAARDPRAVLGPPDHDQDAREDDWDGFVTLGCRGSITVEFVDNALVDVPGPDLHVWEIGPDVEPTAVAISGGGQRSTDVGVVSGGTASLDIAGVAQPGASYRYVRLTDVECQGRGNRWPGADLDAVAAVGSAERFTFEADVLFGFDEAVLSEAARAELDRFAGRLAGRTVSRLQVEGHTDAAGPASYNSELSGRRAEAVRDYLGDAPSLEGVTLTVRAAGESEPVATNETDEGRRQNRRVEILAVP